MSSISIPPALKESAATPREHARPISTRPARAPQRLDALTQIYVAEVGNVSAERESRKGRSVGSPYRAASGLTFGLRSKTNVPTLPGSLPLTGGGSMPSRQSA